MNESIEQTPPFNPSGAMPVSGMIITRESPNIGLIPGQWYWVTYSFSRWTETLFGGSADKPIRLQETVKLQCKAVNGDSGLFETRAGNAWAPSSCCVLTTPPQEEKGFFKRFFGL